MTMWRTRWRFSTGPTRSRGRLRTRCGARASAYKIIGGVRFYERKEIKDALAYLRLILNPHDDVSLRRVINVPGARDWQGRHGIARGGGSSRVAAELPPLLAGLQPVATNNSLWAKLVHAIDQRRLPPRALASLTAFRDLLAALTAMAAQESVSIALGKVLDQSGYLQDLRDERSEEARGPRREPGGARVGRARIRDAQPRSRRSPASSISCRCSPTRTKKPARATRACS